MSADNGSITVLEISPCFHGLTEISSPCENDRFSFAIDHSQPNRKTNEANTRPAEIRCRSHPVSNEREDENSSPAGNYRARICMKVKKKTTFFPVRRVISFSLSFSRRTWFAIFGCDRRTRVFEYEIVMIIICGNNKIIETERQILNTYKIQ